MTAKDELFRAEDQAWTELHELVHAVDAAAAGGAYSDDWTVKDLLAHIACWQAEAASILCQIREGTFAGWEEDDDTVNTRFLEATRDLVLDDVLVQLHAARTRMLEELDVLPEDKLAGDAADWFRGSAQEHYRDHVSGLREALGR